MTGAAATTAAKRSARSLTKTQYRQVRTHCKPISRSTAAAAEAIQLLALFRDFSLRPFPRTLSSLPPAQADCTHFRRRFKPKAIDAAGSSEVIFGSELAL
jgi:hypothetical protein